MGGFDKIYTRGSDKMFFNSKGLSDIAKVLVKLNLHQTWPLIYFLIKLTLIFPVVSASVEQSCYVERKIFTIISNDIIIHRFNI
ncbi:hypothetical protein H5410_015059 [Solanum commersonii]|uniref:Uncharacterized protein n=1 Tax=Solanum commersonii TaxID=4109 RepID=A0A9J5ZT04_SOLCO|nr:hypothetical protein H5410_015059 [Solanum commersonii]